MLNVVMPSVIMLSVIMLNVVMLSVVAPFGEHALDFKIELCCYILAFFFVLAIFSNNWATFFNLLVTLDAFSGVTAS